MEAIFDSEGKTVAWRSKETVFDLDGTPRAYFRGGILSTYTGDFLGRYEDGFYRDDQGRPVAFQVDATGGPILPTPQPLPIAPVPVYPAAPQQTATPPPPPRMRAMRWSPITWEQYIADAKPVAR